MLRIAVCDDNIEDLSNTVSIINDYIALQKDKKMISYTSFQNAVDLITVMENGQKYDLILLDILMPYLTGMEAAKEIRQFNKDVKIIFITSSSDFAVDSYSVDAYYYALKPMWKDKLIVLLDKVISDMEIDKGTSFLVKSKTGLTRIYTNKLEFAEIIGKSLVYHFIDGSIIEAAGSMSGLEKDLRNDHCFIKPHRSYIVNMNHIDTINPKSVKMQSQILVPLAKARFNIVKSTYLNFAFKKV